MTSEVVPASFRDPSGFVFTRDGEPFRQVNRSFQEDYDHLMASGLYGALVEEGLLLPHEEVGPAQAATEDAYRVLRPEKISFVSYPYEWCFGELKDAALATLAIQRKSLAYGMTLRDASAYNIQFRGGRPVMIDTLSFGKLRTGRPWSAYRQFCQHFLAPLALMSHVDVRLGQLLRVHIDGVPLDLAARLLPARAGVRLPLLLHLFLHARSQRHHASVGQSSSALSKARPFSLAAFQGLIDSLERGIRRMKWDPGRTTWAGYYSETQSYSPEALSHKEGLVDSCIEKARPTSVWDLGANTGRFSQLAAGKGIPTVAFDLDPGAVELHYRAVLKNGERNVLPLVLDLTNPSPGIGWENWERMTLPQRGPADAVLALALIHHLAIGDNVPLDRLASFFRRLCTWLIVEFIPKSDPQVQGMLAFRDDVFPDYSLAGFERAFSSQFSISYRERIRDSERALYLMKGRGQPIDPGRHDGTG